MTVLHPQTIADKEITNQPSQLSYVLITAARNEVSNIDRTINCVIAQSVRPLRWIIVSDGSTDGTDELAMRYCARHDWIELLRTQERSERHFAGKVAAFNAGYAHVNNLPYDLIGNIDADISFDKDFFAFLLTKFRANPRLGVGGAPFRQDEWSYDFKFSSIDHVSGACQLFRRQCFIDIGGYIPIKTGGIDVVAVLTARMRGWQTKTFTDKYYLHHRKMGTAKSSVLRARYMDGQKDYSLGAHPVWVAFRAIYQMTKKPFILNGSLLLAGYASSIIMRKEKAVSSELIRFRRRDQMRRLREFLVSLVNGCRSHP